MEILMIGIVAFITGIIASMGLGGGFVLLLYLTAIADVPQMEAQWINLLFFLPIGLLSLWIHHKNGLIERTVLLPTLTGALFGVLLGALAANHLGNELLQKLFALFLIVIGCRELFGKESSQKEKCEQTN